MLSWEASQIGATTQQPYSFSNKVHTTSQILLVPVFHKSDLPFACDFFSTSTCTQGWWSCHNHPRSDGAGGGCADLIGLDVTRGSWRTQKEKKLNTIQRTNLWCSWCSSMRKPHLRSLSETWCWTISYLVPPLGCWARGSAAHHLSGRTAG